MSLLLQYMVIAWLVLASLLFMSRKLAPQPVARLQRAAAAACLRPSRSRVVQALGRWLNAVPAAGGQCGDCDACSGCGSAARGPADLDGQPLVFHARRPK